MAKIAIVSMVRNEADVIESFVRHNLQVADALYIIDHASTDGTGEILQQLTMASPSCRPSCSPP